MITFAQALQDESAQLALIFFINCVGQPLNMSAPVSLMLYVDSEGVSIALPPHLL